MIAVCIDIGSTWTKGAAFEVDADAVTIRQRATTPTTVCNLFDGFCSVLRALLPGDALAMCKSGQVELFYSSSAKGGLAVAAIGLVPEITLEIGKIAAQSAGAKLTVMRRSGHLNPRLRAAAWTRSPLSRTAESGRPTSEKAGRPPETSASTATAKPFRPFRP